MKYLLFFLIFFVSIYHISCSRGDRSQPFKKCMLKCTIQNCSDDNTFLDADERPFHLHLLQWDCQDECKYACMWETIDYFESNNWHVPQFFGKWPFVRFYGIQEPASVLFSIMNFYVHCLCIKNFRKNVRPDSPMYWVWHAFCAVSLNAWFWSTVFHTRDFPLTEFLDYSFAFSIILMTCYCMCLRFLLGNAPRFMMILVTSLFAAFYINHIAYLSGEKFDYAYNMMMNLIVGGVTVISWFAWALYNRYRQPYVWKVALFFSLFALTTVLEVFDRPPWFYLIDCHALWHFSSAPITFILYSFIIDDCKYLRKHAKYDIIENVLKTKSD